jgi:hypothetical protein
MAKIVLIAFVVLALASATKLRGAEQAAPGNYDDLQEFLTGFMTGYTGSSENLAACLTESTQDNLNQILASTYFFMITEQFKDIKAAYVEFLQVLAKACYECGLGSVEESLRKGMTEKGKIWFEVNAAFHFGQVEVAMNKALGQLKDRKYSEAGATVGQLSNLLVPFEKRASLSASLTFEPAAYQAWWKGLVSSLAVNNKKYGPCARYLLNFANTTIAPITDLDKLAKHDLSGFSTLFGDLATSLSYVNSQYTGFCQFDLLYSNIEDLASKNGLEELLTRYASRAISINSAFINIKDCSANTYSCGQGYGVIIKYLLNWSIN